ncbi:hypothetical protein SHKM778_55890 [Streptomyces sp. KM77-8]|uniref:Uncharacterized protein n=1 Tax=Streptomyces haneummycinicus TaxID=3074435 RepID=A0AAT9HP04_9ACTN
MRLFAGQRRTWWEAHARLVLIGARHAAGHVSGRLVADAAAVAGRLAALGAPAAPRRPCWPGGSPWTWGGRRRLSGISRSPRGADTADSRSRG